MQHADATATPCRGRLWFRPVRQRGRPFAVEPRLYSFPRAVKTPWVLCRCDRCRAVVFVPVGRVERRVEAR